MTHPRHYDYSHPTLTADLVMKGGITSGVVYPHAVCELAQTYEFRNVGGTSAGAIAAALAAAAEHGRFKDGFAKLAELPDWLGNDGHLFRTFQPQAPTRRLFAVFTAGIGVRQRALRVLAAAVRQYPVSAAVGACPGVAATRLAASDGGGVRLVAPLALAVGGAFAGLGVSLYRAVTRGLPENFFGLCTGMPGAADTDHPAVTPWLTETINDLAGLDPDGAPLTFGDLTERNINLEMVTTSLSNGRPFQLPFRDEKRRFYFDSGEMRRLFPGHVVDWMEAHPAEVEAADAEYAELERRLVRPLHPLPAWQDLPVVVATRMSLSFPGLMSAVPLCAIDGTRDANIAAHDAWKQWLASRRRQWAGLRNVDPARWDGAPSARPGPEPCWFSDGGIVSNFPVHFFDSPLPRRPTFAINLRPYPPDKDPSRDECQNVWLPPTEEAGARDWWYPRWKNTGYRPVAGFARAILDTMQNWSDNAQIRVPGYRDRVVHVNHTKAEGGMNLNMGAEKVAALTARGRCAGEQLAERFSQPPEDKEPSWDSHRWLRFRSTLSLLEQMLEQMGASWTTDPPGPIETSYRALLGRALQAPPENFPWADEEHRRQATIATGHLLELIENFGQRGEVFRTGAPEPKPQLRIMPHW